jgi:hypothetical protein
MSGGEYLGSYPTGRVLEPSASEWRWVRSTTACSSCLTTSPSTHSLSCFPPMKADSSKYGRKHQIERRRWQAEMMLAGESVQSAAGLSSAAPTGH